MMPDRWKLIRLLLQLALEQPVCQRDKFIEENCDDVLELFREVQSLLKNQEKSNDFLEKPVPTFDGFNLSSQELQLLSPNSDKLFVERYLIHQEIGVGGIAGVWLAYDKQNNSTPVVIKLLLPHREIEEWICKKFIYEIEALKRIEHPNVVKLIDNGQLPTGRRYLVMEYIDGVTLRELIEPDGMDITIVIDIIDQLGKAITCVHQQSIIHRDLKPENIMIIKQDDKYIVKVIDFGISTVKEHYDEQTKTTELVGTIAYMAPEQLEGRPKAASDIYTMAVIAYEMLTGRKPFSVDTMNNVASIFKLLRYQRQRRLPIPSELRSSLTIATDQVLLRTLSYQIELRPSSADEFSQQLISALNGQVQIPSEPPLIEVPYILVLELANHHQISVNELPILLNKLSSLAQTIAANQNIVHRNQLLHFITGKNVVLVFFHNPLSLLDIAVKLAKDCQRSQQSLIINMAIHTGPVYRIFELASENGIHGDGILITQEIIRYADSGHILLSKNFVDLLGRTEAWRNHIKPLGPAPLRDFDSIVLYNLVKGDCGNSDIPGWFIEQQQGLTKQPSSIPIDSIPVKVRFKFYYIVIIVIAIIGLWGVWLYRPVEKVVAAPKPVISYWIKYQEFDPKTNKHNNPFRHSGDISGIFYFRDRDMFQFILTSYADGYFYLVNEAPVLNNNLPQFTVMFPSKEAHYNSPKIKLGEKFATSYNVVHEAPGLEKIWLIWSEQPVAELSNIYKLAETENRIKDPSQINSLKEFLEKQVNKKPLLEYDEAQSHIVLKSSEKQIVYLWKLYHR